MEEFTSLVDSLVAEPDASAIAGTPDTVPQLTNAVMEGLSTLEEFCINSTDAVNTIYRMMGESDEQLLQNLNSIEQLLPSVTEMPADTSVAQSNSNDSTSAEAASADLGPSYCELTASERPTPGGILSVIGTERLMPSPVPPGEEPASKPTETDATPPNPGAALTLNVSEMEIDAAFQTVFNGFDRCEKKDVVTLIDAKTMQHCLDYVRTSPSLLCPTCLEVFQEISPFQVHLQVCVAPPCIQLKQKMDQAAIERLACDIWKDVFIKKLKELNVSPAHINREDYIRSELDQVWKTSSLDPVARCREIFIRVAVEIITRKWRDTALANEIQRLNKASAAKVKKRVVVESESETPETTERPRRKKSLTDSSCPTDTTQSSPKKKKRGPKKAKAKKSETDRAVEALVADQAEMFSNTPNHEIHHVMPDTPVSMATGDLMTPRSDRGADMPVINILLGDKADLTPEPEKQSPYFRGSSSTSPPPDLSVSANAIDIDTDVDNLVEENKTTDINQAAAAVNHLENIEDWDCGTEESPLNEDEFVVDKILARRLVCKIESGMPEDEHYEYLVSWVGYSEEENSWEPYANLTHCPQRLQEFLDRMNSKSVRRRSRGGKRF